MVVDEEVTLVREKQRNSEMFQTERLNNLALNATPKFLPSWV